MLNYSLKIGLVPDIRDVMNLDKRKGMFEPAKGVENKEKAISFIKEKFEDDNTKFVDLEWLNKYGLLVKSNECEAVRDYFLKEQVDAIFIINCNFGNEEACGRLAKMMNLPVLLWGPQDMLFEENGQRYTDAQCGLFAISKQLRRYNIPFSYIENCPVESPAFSKGVEKFLSVVTMVKNFKKMTITQVGARLNSFKSVMANELELTEEFGFNLNMVNMTAFTEKYNEHFNSDENKLILDSEEIKKKYDLAGIDDETLKKLLNFVATYIDIFNETNTDVITTECWNAMPKAVGVTPCLAMSILYDMGYNVVCETDIHGAVTSALLSCAARGRKPTAYGEFTTRHPENENAELLWHCGPFPYSLKAENSKATLLTGKPNFRAKDGEYTIARFQGDNGKYTLLGGEYHTVDGPNTTGTYMWAEFKNLPKVEKKLIEGPYIHHMSEIYGNYADVLEEFCKYIPNLEYDPIEN